MNFVRHLTPGYDTDRGIFVGHDRTQAIEDRQSAADEGKRDADRLSPFRIERLGGGDRRY